MDGRGHRGAGLRSRVSAPAPGERRRHPHGLDPHPAAGVRAPATAHQRVIAATSTTVVVGLLVWLLPKTSGWQEVRSVVLRLVGVPRQLPADPPRLLAGHPHLPRLRAVHRRRRPARGDGPQRAGAGAVPAAAARDAVHRPRARRAGDPVDHPARLRRSQAAADARVVRPARSSGVPSPSCSPTRRTWPRSSAPGSRASTSRSAPPPVRSGCRPGQTMRSVVLPQAVRRVVPPLMNDLVSLQKDVALISILGPVEALRRAGIVKARLVQLHARTSSPPCCSSACRSR